MKNIIKSIYTWLHSFDSLPKNAILTQISLHFNEGERLVSKLSLQARNSLMIYTVKGTVFSHQYVTIIAKFIVTDDVPKGRLHFGHGGNFSFHQEDIDLFLEAVNDQNPIHQGSFPVVPGLMLVNHYLQHIPKEQGVLTVRFNQPLLVGTSFNYVSEEEKITVESDDLVIATITHESGD
jgi:hypothetical protein